MSIAKNKNRFSKRPPQRQLAHEPLEQRMLLSGDAGWVLGIGGGDTAEVGGFQSFPVVDAEGNVYVGGQITYGPVDFDPGPGVVASSSETSSQGFVAKYNPQGSLLWAKEVGAGGVDRVWAGALDAHGNLYIAGNFEQTVTFDNIELTSAGGTDIFVAKLDSAGNYQWAIRAGSEADDHSENAKGVAVDSEGSIYIAGVIADTADFGSYQLVPRYAYDSYVAKLDSQGNFVWAENLGGSDSGANYVALAVDSNQSVYIAGIFRGTATFGSYQLVSSSPDYHDAYIAELAANDGEVLWVQHVAATQGASVEAIDMDRSGDVYATGRFSGVAYIGGTEIIGNGVGGGFVARLGSGGTVQWVNVTEQSAGDLIIDAEGNVCLVGQFNDSKDFDPGPDQAVLNSLFGGEGFLWRLDPDGNYIAARRTGGPPSGITLDASGTAYLAGRIYYNHPAPYSFPSGEELTAAGRIDMFVEKLPSYMFETHIVLFSDSFENGQWNGLWVQDSQNDWFTSTQRKTLGSYSAEVDGKATDAKLTVATPIDLTPYGSAELTFDWYIENTLDVGEYLAVDLFNGTTWTEVARLSGDVNAEDLWHQPYVQVPDEYLVSNFQFRFRAKMSGSEEDANVDNVQLVATSLADTSNQPPVATDDAATTSAGTAVTIDVLANDNDADNDTLSVASVTQPAHGAVVNNGVSVTYTPNAGYSGIDSLTYTVSDGRGGTDTGTVSIEVLPAGSDTALYVYDIRFESKRANKDWRAVYGIRSDSNGDGQGGATDNVAAGVAITVEFAGQTYTGVTDANGVFYTNWINNLSSGNHYAEVVDLVLAGYYWNPLSLLNLEDDSDGDGKPDSILYR